MTSKEAMTTNPEGYPLLDESFATAGDGTRLYVRRRPAALERRPPPASQADGPAPALGEEPAGRDPSGEAAAGSSVPTALLSDGILCDGFIWKYLWDALATRLPVAHWHYRGHGRSANPVDAEAIDIAQHADDLGHVRRHLGDPPVVLLGHSMGCQVELEAYKQRPDKVRALVLLCGSYGRVTETFRNTNLLSRVLPKMLDKVLANPEVSRALWSRVPPEVALRVALMTGEVDPKTIRPEDMRPYLQHMTHVDLPMFLKMLRAAGEHTAAELLPNIACPVLIVAGERDMFTPAYLAEEMASRIPGAELFVVPGGTHVAPLEQRDAVNQRNDDFLRERALP
jgi:pimeloyl-ACP methyl ester carboxylesterase